MSRTSPTIDGLLGLGEEAHGLDEGDGQEDHARQQRGDGDRDPHLLTSTLDDLDELAVHVAADAPRFVADETAEVACLAVEREDGDELVERVDLCERRPLPKRIDLGQALTDPPDDAREISAAAALPARRE